MDGVPGQIGTVLVGILLLLSTSLLAPEQIFWLGFVAAAACVAIVIAIRRRYADALLRTLRSGLGEQILEGGRGLGDLLAAPDVRAALIAALQAPDAGTREMAAVLLARSPEADARRALAAALERRRAGRSCRGGRARSSSDAADGDGPRPDRAESCLGSLATATSAARAASLDALRRLRRPLARPPRGAVVPTRHPRSGPPRWPRSENTTTPKAADALARRAQRPVGPRQGRRRRDARRPPRGRPSGGRPPRHDRRDTTEAAAIAALAGRGEPARDRILAVGRRRGHARAGAQRALALTCAPAGRRTRRTSPSCAPSSTIACATPNRWPSER